MTQNIQSKRTNTGVTKTTKTNDNLDKRLLKYADEGLSPQEISEIMNIPAAEVAIKIRRILEDRDWLSILERQKLNLLQFHKIKSRLFERVDKDYVDADLLKEYINATKVMDEMLDRATKITDDQLAVVSDAQARALVKLFSFAWDDLLEWMASEYPQVDTAAMSDVFNDGLRNGAREISPVE